MSAYMPAVGISGPGQVVDDDLWRPGQVPVIPAVHCWVLEACQVHIKPGKEAADIVPQRWTLHSGRYPVLTSAQSSYCGKIIVPALHI